MKILYIAILILNGCAAVNTMTLSSKHPNPVMLVSANNPLTKIFSLCIAPKSAAAIKTNSAAVVVPYAVVDFGTHRLELDVGTGVSVNFAADKVSVQVGLESFDGTIVSADEVKVDVLGSLVPSKTSNALATRTKYVVKLAPGETKIIEVPAFSKKLLVHRYTDVDTKLKMSIKVFPNNLAGAVYSLNVNEGIDMQQIELPPMSRFVAITNSDTSRTINIGHLIFELDIR